MENGHKWNISDLDTYIERTEKKEEEEKESHRRGSNGIETERDRPTA